MHDIHVEGMLLPDVFQDVAVIEKLTPSWKDFKSYLKLKQKEMTLEELITKLEIHEGSRRIAGWTDDSGEAKANLME
ncbi:hypothetical protein ACS0TY_024914 [Phlomoides rotata]